MYTLKFDTLKFAQRLRDEAKFPPEQAEKAATVFTETIIVGFTEWQEQQQLATKADLTATENRLAGETVAVKVDIAAMKNQLAADLAIAIEQTKVAIATAKAETIKWVFGMMLAQTAFLYGMARLH